MIWSEMKNKVAEANTTFKLRDVKRHTIEAIKSIDKTFWQKCEDHVKKEESRYWEKDGLNFPAQPSVVVNLIETSSDSE